MNYPGIGGELARVAGYTCTECGQQVISSVPIERCESCRSVKRSNGEQDRLFAPVDVMPGQIGMDV
jgi:hypothetical protein